MLDFFTIFSKGGIVLWCFQGTSQFFTPSVNALIKSVILQERTGNNSFNHDALTLKYKLDNEFELVFVVAYQKILQLSYVDKFLSDIQMEFRNKYKDDLQQGKVSRQFDFDIEFSNILRAVEESSRQQAQKPKKMKTFEESQKSKKTVSSMIENKKDDGKGQGGKSKENKNKKAVKEAAVVVDRSPKPAKVSNSNGELSQEEIMLNRQKFMAKMMKGNKPESGKSPESPKKPKGKKPTLWENGGRESKSLDYSGAKPDDALVNGDSEQLIAEADLQLLGQMKGELKDMEPDSESEGEEEEEEEVEVKGSAQKKRGLGMFSALRNLVGSKTLTKEDLKPMLEKMKDHLIGKNVAAEIAQKLCDSVATKLEGRVLGTFSGISSTVKQTLNESCVQILSPKRRVDILRDALESQKQRRPFVITFCGVNGVGKSTNLAKVAFWLVENGFRVLIAACDTFRAGAVEQLRTHTRKLNALHASGGAQQKVQLYEKGYGKDSAGIAMEAINYARDSRIDVVLVDTAGRMQDNEPLMRALAKLIKVNQPDLVLFVGEALVGNEAVDQLTKFNQALADHSNMENPRLIDGIILTKFDTIDDKVGAAISMTYTTGQPIVFVGTGQTYTDLRNLNAKAVVSALLK
ncbi:signal recognition particle receptor subunit alpha-like [Liolophura sinensis]|uniref:signal recognition particle receptor subunit alpha-like n=1 Tax=Liolophura sinensis TaxID=3198878 RepID=UPI0031588D0E